MSPVYCDGLKPAAQRASAERVATDQRNIVNYKHKHHNTNCGLYHTVKYVTIFPAIRLQGRKTMKI